MSNEDWTQLGSEFVDSVQSAIDSGDFSELSDLAGRTWSRYSGMAPQKKASERTGQRPAVDTYRQPRVRMFGSTTGTYAAGMAETAFGAVLIGLFGVSELSALTAGLAGAFSAGLLATMVFFAAFIAGGLWLFRRGRKNLKLTETFQKIRAYIKSKDDGEQYCELRELEEEFDLDHEKLVNDIQSMIDKRMLPQGHLDKQKKNLILTDALYKEYRASQRSYEERAKEEAARQAEQAAAAAKAAGNPNLTKEAAQVIIEGRNYLEKIKESNRAIPDAEVTAKISHMEDVVDKILNRVTQKPELVDDLRKFMKYYLPTTCKLLDAYEDLDRQDVQGQNIQSSKREIENTLDTINLAFENLLDSFYEDDAMDISTDIEVMEMLMAQEGLLADKQKKAAAAQAAGQAAAMAGQAGGAQAVQTQGGAQAQVQVRED